jgi:hypothetical protein
MQLLNIYTKREYEKEGEKKTFWNRVGFLKIADDGKLHIRLFLFPDTQFFVFDKKEAKQEAES